MVIDITDSPRNHSSYRRRWIQGASARRHKQGTETVRHRRSRRATEIRQRRNHLRNLTKVGRFWLETKNQDPHGRTIAIVYKDGKDAEHTLNYAMVRDGWAYWYSRYERQYNKTPDGELEMTDR